MKKKDVQSLFKEYKDIPHVVINDNVDYPKRQMLEWMKKINK
jgi:hypothetical protein